MTPDAPFWRRKRLDELTAEQWESLCDGCGRCCLVKIEDEEAGTIHYTDICCDHLDRDTCRCTRYEDRFDIGADCVELTPDNVAEVAWLPRTCAYRLLAAGHDLPPWHPLVTGSDGSVHEAGASVAGRVVPEATVDDDDLDDHIVDGSW